MTEHITESCPTCEFEAELMWDVKANGYTAYCPFCGHRLMLCSACLEDNDCDVSGCDYCTSTDSCRQQNVNITLETFPEKDCFYSTEFAVKSKWLSGRITGDYKDIADFLNKYIWDESYQLYMAAKAENQLIYAIPTLENEQRRKDIER